LWICFNPHTGQTQQLQLTWRPAPAQQHPPGGLGLLGPWPTGPPQRPATWVPPGQQACTTQLAPLHGRPSVSTRRHPRCPTTRRLPRRPTTRRLPWRPTTSLLLRRATTSPAHLLPGTELRRGTALLSSPP
jgi:hypothetical protein